MEHLWSQASATDGPPVGTPGAIDGDDCGDAQEIDQLALAGGRVAWTYTEYTMSIHTSELVTTTLRSRRQKDISADNDRNDYLGNLGGHGELLVFNRWKELRSGRVFRFQLWRITGHDAASARLIRSGPDAMKVATVDGRRVVIYTRDGRIVILQASAARLTDFRVGRGASEFFLSGSELGLRRGRTIEIYDVTRGKRVGSRVLHRPSNPLRLAGLRGSIAVYMAGIAIHVLRLSDGRDVVLRLPNEAGPADAALVPQGLYYSYNQAYSARPGRIGFIPIEKLLAHLR